MTFLKKLLRPMIALLVLGVLVWKGPFKVEQLQFAITQVDILIAGLICVLTQNIVFSIRWRTFVHRLNSDVRFSLASAYKLSLIGMFFSFFIPGGVGGDVVKALELSKEKQVPRSEALSTVLADRILGLFSILIFSTVCLAIETYLDQTDLNIRLFLTSLLMFSGLCFILFLSKPSIIFFERFFANRHKSPLLEKIIKLVKSFEMTTQAFRQKSVLLKTVSVTLIAQLLSISFLYFVVERIHGSTPAFFLFFSLCCFGFVASAIPITPAGIGVGQAAFYFMFSKIDEGLGTASITALSLYQIFVLFVSLIGGYLFSTKGKKKVDTYEEIKT